MNARQLLDTAEARGWQLSVRGDFLIVCGECRVANDALMQALRVHKAEVIALLQRRDLRAVVPYRLRDGLSGQLIDPDGMDAAIAGLLQRYGPRLDREALLAWLLMRKACIWPSLPAYLQAKEQAALQRLRRFAGNPALPEAGQHVSGRRQKPCRAIPPGAA